MTQQSEWYYQIMGETFGPMTAEQFKSLAADGTIDRDTLIRRGEAGNWATADRVRGLFDPVTSDPGTKKVTPKIVTPPERPEQPTATLVPADLGLPIKRRFTAIHAGLVFGLVSLLVLGVVILSARSDKVKHESGGALEVVSEIGTPAEDTQLPTRLGNLMGNWENACEIIRSYTSNIESTPDQELQRARSLLTEFTAGLQAGEMPSERKIAEELITHIDSVLSDSKVYGWLVTLDGATLISIQKEYSVAVPTETLQAFCPSFGLPPGANSNDSFFRVIKGRGDGTLTEIDLNLREYATVLEAAFIERMYRQLGEALNELGRQELLRRKQRVAARDPNPALTAEIHQVDENVDLYEGKCVYFDPVWVGGDVERREDGFFVVEIEDSRGARYSGSRSKLVFVCHKSLADRIRAELDANKRGQAKIYCDVFKVAPDKNISISINGQTVEQSRASAEIYKLEFYNQAGQLFRMLSSSE
ncbi:MAG: DUF4339 domain-containing protein [Planctomycetaceae bacterium]|nr:DUF4339 domain-containing protein [Planctomycetales bacterium]MCB9921759.1 DUF4339 domain-containing protein [Planctomycetaceae bacterium]